MSGADAASHAIKGAVKAMYAPVHRAGSEYAKAYQAISATTDVVETMRQAVLLVIAVEHLKDMATEAEKSARAVLGDQMLDTGATNLSVTDRITAFLSKKKTFLSSDPDAVAPDKYYVTKRELDKDHLKADLEAGVNVPGWSVRRPNGMTLNIKTRKG